MHSGKSHFGTAEQASRDQQFSGGSKRKPIDTRMKVPVGGQNFLKWPLRDFPQKGKVLRDLVRSVNANRTSGGLIQ